MTTEILRSMLYRGSELMREVAWVIYDEVHYMRDSERGVVWEESIILLPHKVRFVFLSATIPNAAQFADWITEIHHQPCHVVYTNYRPVPLQHYIFPQNGEGLHLVVDERGKFREANFQKAMATLQSSNVDVASAEALLSSGNGKGMKRKRAGNNQKKQGSDLHRIVKLIMERNLNPVIVFSFSKKDCERYAIDLHREDYTDEVEKDLISQVYTSAIESLSEDDRQLPQVVALLPLLKRGIGIHHGGLLPILKEIVEILFSEGLIKALFATETFSIGINMPAKTVVFTNTRKWDGKDFRWVTSGEYIQMSGRAGRRGKDDRGIVIQMVDEKMEPAVCKGILYGDPDPLNSSYRISYNMLLNMMRVEDIDPEYLLRASFHQFQREKEVPALLSQAEDLEQQASQIDLGSPEEADLVSQYYQMDLQLLMTRKKMMKIVRKPEHILKFLQKPGRFLDISIEGESYGWGALVASQKKMGTGTAGAAGKLAEQTNEPTWSLDVLLFCVDRHSDSKEKTGRGGDDDAWSMLWRGTNSRCRPALPSDDPKLVSMRLFTVGLDSIDRISAVKLFIPSDIHPPEARKTVGLSIREVKKRFPDGVPLLDPVKDLGVNAAEFKTLMERAQELTERMANHKLSTEINEDENCQGSKTLSVALNFWNTPRQFDLRRNPMKQSP
jgi:ATP-dependent RNA helicase DOB1